MVINWRKRNSPQVAISLDLYSRLDEVAAKLNEIVAKLNAGG
jgi:hypothetical protein